MNTNLLEIKTQLIEYLKFFYDSKSDYNISYVINNFLFDYITELGSLEISQDEQRKFILYSSSDNDKEFELFIKKSLKKFLFEFEKSRLNTPIKFEIPNNLKSPIFAGLEYFGNNDADYTNLPSAFTLCSFVI